jgi:transcriptional regulator with XRE-family HTH domain
MEANIGTRIKVARIEKGLQQKQLAEEIGMAASNLSQIEHNKRVPSLRQLRTISDALGVDFGLSSDADSRASQQVEHQAPSLGEIIDMINNYPRLTKKDKKIINELIRALEKKWELETLEEEPW